ncbi:hypothetical protein [Arthrobacter rhombi]|uniref:hypothetical protein n=1 Tax=Arthrobacter rhombi TaxID=71253 RepID=UPI003F90A6A7
MNPADEFPAPSPGAPATSIPGDGKAAEGLPETGDGLLDSFPEALAAGDVDAGEAIWPRGSALGFRVVLYAALSIGVVAGLSLIAAWGIQAVLTGSYLRGGGEYFGSGIEASTARELLSLPVGGFISVLLLCLIGMCIGVWGIQRGKAAHSV